MIKIDLKKWTTVAKRAEETKEKANSLWVKASRARSKSGKDRGEDYWFIPELGDLLLVPKVIPK